MGKCAKLAPRFCGPFTVLKRIGSSTYRLTLPDGVEIHPVFHVSRLKELLGFGDNTITTGSYSSYFRRFSFKTTCTRDNYRC